MKNDFSIMKWLIFPAIATALAFGIAYVNVRMFGFEGSLLYIILLSIIVAISLILVLHTGSKHNLGAMRAAFVFETLGLFALAATVIFAITVSRELAGSKEDASASTEQIKAIAGIKSRKAQAELAKTIKSDDGIASAYKSAEDKLFWPLVAETGLYFLALVTVFGITIFASPEPSKAASESTSEYPSKDASTKNRSASLYASTRQAAFSASNAVTIPKAGRGSAKFRLSEGVRTKVIYFHPPNGKGKYCCTVSDSEYEKLSLATYSTVAEYVLAKLKQRQTKEGIEAARLIRESL